MKIEKSQAPDLDFKNHELFQLLVDAVTDYAIFALDVDGRVLTWNKGAERLKGYKEEEILGQHFSKFYLAEDIQRNHPANELKLALKDGRYEEEGWRLKKDGSRFWANLILTPMYDRSARHIGFTKVTRDLTERKKSEEELKAAYGGLERKIKEKTQLLEDALRARDEFLSIASHELKTPITSIKMQVQMAQHRLLHSIGKELEVPKLTKGLNVTLNQVERLTHLIDDLLDISQIQSGKLQYNFERFNFCDLLLEVLEGFDQQLALTKNEVKLLVDQELEGNWDRTRIEQVLVNLISNASKYASGTPIEITASRVSESVVISVHDTGPGISEEMRSKIFGKFERLGQSSNLAGLGLGLYISKQVILAHGGTLELKKSEGDGSTFVITLPQDSEK